MQHNDWFAKFSQHRSPLFSAEDFAEYKGALVRDLPNFEKFLLKGARILDVGCGFGFKAVPLSTLGYEVVGIDVDPQIVEVAQRNAENFGGKIEILEGNALALQELFEPDSFDVCFSAGVLEHFEEDDARKVMDLQLEIAPTVIAIMPLHGGDPGDEGVHIHANFWSEEEWLNRVLKGYNVVEHFSKRLPFGDGEERELLYLVVER